MKRYLFSILLSLLAYSAIDAQVHKNYVEMTSAQRIGTSDTYWEYDNAGTLIISGTGDIPDFNEFSGQPWSSNLESIKKIIIQSRITGIGTGAFAMCEQLVDVKFEEDCKLESIGNLAFGGCKNLLSFTIPNGVTSLGENPFSLCENLIEITVEPGNTTYCSDNGVLYNKNKTTLISYPGGNSRTSFTFPNTVTSIENYAFIGNRQLASINFEPVCQLQNIGANAFSLSNNLASFTIPNSVTSIGDYAFSMCGKLTDVTVFWDNPQNILYGNDIFTNVSSIGLNVPAGKKSAYLAVDTWKDFDIIDPAIPDVPAQIGNSDTYWLLKKGVLTISGTGAIPDFHPMSMEQPWETKRSQIRSLFIQKEITNIGDFSFQQCTKLTTVNFEQGSQLQSIGGYAFFMCLDLANLSIPGSVSNIKDYAFNTGGKITDITVEWTNPQNVTYGSSIFPYSTNTKLYVPDGKKPEYLALDVWKDFDIIDAAYPENPKQIGSSGAYWLLKKGILTISGTGNIPDFTNINEQPWAANRDEITSLIIQKEITGIGKIAFSGCDRLINITFEQGSQLTSIGSSAFLNCIALTSISIPSSVISIANSSFKYCSGLATVSFSGNSQLTSLGSGAFDSCSSLTSVTIPQGVKVIDAFSNCTQLEEILFEYGSKLISIPKYAFYECKNLKSIRIPSGVTAISVAAFYRCSSLSSIIFEEESQLQTIESSAFLECESLHSITIPSGVTSIGREAFSGCLSLTDISVMSGNQNYLSENGVLYNKNKTTLLAYPVGNLRTSFAIPKSVISISNNAFYGCSHLNALTTEADCQLENINYMAFANSYSLTSVSIPQNVKNIDHEAFNNCTNLTDIIVEWADPGIVTYGSGIFLNVEVSSVNLHIPFGKKAIYQSTEPWSGFNIMEENTGIIDNPCEKATLLQIGTIYTASGKEWYRFSTPVQGSGVYQIIVKQYASKDQYYNLTTNIYTGNCICKNLLSNVYYNPYEPGTIELKELPIATFYAEESVDYFFEIWAYNVNVQISLVKVSNPEGLSCQTAKTIISGTISNIDHKKSDEFWYAFTPVTTGYYSIDNYSDIENYAYAEVIQGTCDNLSALQEHISINRYTNQSNFIVFWGEAGKKYYIKWKVSEKGYLVPNLSYSWTLKKEENPVGTIKESGIEITPRTNISVSNNLSRTYYYFRPTANQEGYYYAHGLETNSPYPSVNVEPLQKEDVSDFISYRYQSATKSVPSILFYAKSGKTYVIECVDVPLWSLIKSEISEKGLYENPIVIQPNGNIQATTKGLYNEIVYRFIPRYNAYYSIASSSSIMNGKASVVSVNNSSQQKNIATYLFGNEPAVFYAETGKEYEIHWSNITFDFTWSLIETNINDNRSCQKATDVTVGRNIAGNHQNSRYNWFKFTSPKAGFYSIDKNRNDISSYFELYSTGNTLPSCEYLNSAYYENGFYAEQGEIFYICWQSNVSNEEYSWSIQKINVTDNRIRSLAYPIQSDVSFTTNFDNSRMIWYEFSCEQDNQYCIQTSDNISVNVYENYNSNTNIAKWLSEGTFFQGKAGEKYYLLIESYNKVSSVCKLQTFSYKLNAFCQSATVVNPGKNISAETKRSNFFKFTPLQEMEGIYKIQTTFSEKMVNIYSGDCDQLNFMDQGNGEIYFYAKSGNNYYIEWQDISGDYMGETYFTWDMTKENNVSNHICEYATTIAPGVQPSFHNQHSKSWFVFTPTIDQAGIYSIISRDDFSNLTIATGTCENMQIICSRKNGYNLFYENSMDDLFYAEAGKSYYVIWSTNNFCHTWDLIKGNDSKSDNRFCQYAIDVNEGIHQIAFEDNNELWYRFEVQETGTYSFKSFESDGIFFQISTGDCHQQSEILRVEPYSQANLPHIFYAETGEMIYIQCGKMSYNDYGYFEVSKLNGTGLDEATHELRVSIYPNPTTNKVWVGLPSVELNNIAVFNLYGQKMPVNIDDEGTRFSIKMSDLQNGIYFIQVNGKAYKVIKK